MVTLPCHDIVNQNNISVRNKGSVNKPITVKIYIDFPFAGCDLSNLLLDEGPEATLPEQSPTGYPITYYKPVRIISD